MTLQETITVWGIGSPRTLRVHWALQELALEYNTKPIQTRTPMMDETDFLAVSPGKKIPALQHGDLILTESAAICRYLMDRFSGKSWSIAERATMDRFVFFALTEIDATALYVIRRHAGLASIYGSAPTAVHAAYEYANRQFSVLSDFLRDRIFCMGEHFSEADIHLGSVIDWAAALNIRLPTKLVSYQQRLHEREGYQKAIVANASTND